MTSQPSLHRTILASAARTATNNSDPINMAPSSAAHVIIDVTALSATPSVVPTIQGYDPLSTKWYDILVGVAITATGTTVLKVGPGLGPLANGAASDYLPDTWRLLMTHGDADSITYSVGAWLF